MKKLLYTILCLGLLPFSANATVIDVKGPVFAFVGSGVGTGRGQGIQINTSFSVSSIGIYANLVSQSFDIVVYSSVNGHSAGSVLATASDIVGGTGMGWNDIAINFDFLVGNSYVVNWRPSNGNSSWASIGYYSDSSLPHTVGPLTLVEGFEAFAATNPGNSLHPRLRYVTGVMMVPEPEIFGLFLMGLVGFGLVRRKTT